MVPFLPVVAVSCAAVVGYAQAPVTMQSLDAALQSQHWNEAVQTSAELIRQDPTLAEAKVKGAYALFQKGYANAALSVVSKMPPQSWGRAPQGQARLAEVVALMQKKVPLNLVPSRLDQVNLEGASPYLVDEMRFAKGREAFEANRYDEARQLLQGVPEKSRFFGQSRYLLGVVAMKQGDRQLAAQEFSKVFAPSVYEQASEIWRDLNAQMSAHWGPNLKIILDAELLNETARVGELAILALARLNYAHRDFKGALQQYDKMASSSQYFPRASLEKIWTLLELNDHESAQKAAQSLAVSDTSFEALEAHSIRSLILADAGRTEEARQEIALFMKVYASSKSALANFESTGDPTSLPTFLRTDLKLDRRITQLETYQQDLIKEMQALRSEDQQLFPSFHGYAGMLEPMLTQAKSLSRQLIQTHVAQRRADLESLLLQARLIHVETFLEDREKLRTVYRESEDKSESKQAEHDRKLHELLTRAVAGVDEILASSPLQDSRLMFRQSELLWELANATEILAMTSDQKSHRGKGDELKDRAIRIAQQVASQEQTPSEIRAQASFFSGFALTDMGRLGPGILALQRYTQTYPRHLHAPDAFRIMADARFDANDFAGAESLYKRILEFPESPVVGYALYKIGWCAYNQKDFARTLLALEKAYVWTNRTGQSGQRISLQRESKRDLIGLYAEVGDHRKAKEYFSEFLQADPHPWLVELAQRLDEMGQFDKSGDLYKLLISLEPSAPQNISHQAAIVYGYHQLHKWPEAIVAAQGLAEHYRFQLTSPQGPETPAAHAEKILREAMLAQQFEYKKRSSSDAAQRVNTLDELYLSLFQAWPTSQEPLYVHSHFVLEQKRDREAADLFLKHWTQFGLQLKEPLREEALRNLIAALNQVESQETFSGGGFSQTAARLQEYSEEYEKAYPSTVHTRRIAYLGSALLFKYKQIESALAQTQKLFDANPTDEIGQRCFKNLRTAYYESQNWEKTYNWASDLSARKGASLSTFAGDLKLIREESVFLWANNIQDDAKAADKFAEIAKDPTMERLREKSLFNSFVRAQKANQKQRALNFANELERLSPQYEGLAQIAGLRAALYQEAGDYQRALPLLEVFLKKPDAKVSAETLTQAQINAGLISEAYGQKQMAKHHLDRVPASLAAAQKVRERWLAQSEPVGPSIQWKNLLKASAPFEAHPLPALADLGKRIQRGSSALEGLAKSHFDFSSNPSVNSDEAFEAYCRVPLLYGRLGEAIARVGDDEKGLKPQERLELKHELEKVTQPLNAKAREVAATCLAKSEEAEHDGEVYRRVLAQWGWRADSNLSHRADTLVEKLKARAPWFDEVAFQGTEDEILKLHYEDRASEETWYALARLRWPSQSPGTGLGSTLGPARLTLVDGLSKTPNSGKLLNAYAVTEIDGRKKVGVVLQKAGQQGSSAAWANLALYHLQGGRFNAAQVALKNAIAAGAFKNVHDLEDQAKEFVQP